MLHDEAISKKTWIIQQEGREEGRYTRDLWVERVFM